MNARQLIAASVLAVLGSAAIAGEATQFADPVPTLSRAQVKADAVRSTTAVTRGEASQFIDARTKSTRSREEVRAEARAAARQHSFNALYVGS